MVTNKKKDSQVLCFVILNFIFCDFRWNVTSHILFRLIYNLMKNLNQLVHIKKTILDLYDQNIILY